MDDGENAQTAAEPVNVAKNAPLPPAAPSRWKRAGSRVRRVLEAPLFSAGVNFTAAVAALLSVYLAVTALRDSRKASRDQDESSKRQQGALDASRAALEQMVADAKLQSATLDASRVALEQVKDTVVAQRALMEAQEERLSRQPKIEYTVSIGGSKWLPESAWAKSIEVARSDRLRLLVNARNSSRVPLLKPIISVRTLPNLVHLDDGVVDAATAIPNLLIYNRFNNMLSTLPPDITMVFAMDVIVPKDVASFRVRVTTYGDNMYNTVGRDLTVALR
jgi:hypothetical protein